MRMPLITALVVATGCATTAPSRLPTRVIDLSPTVEADVEQVGYTVPVHLAMATVKLFNHGGSHYDPPSHVLPGGRGVDEEPLEKFIGRARLLDFRAKPRDAALGRADFEPHHLRPGDVVVAFVGCPARSRDRCPYLSADAATYLASIPIRAFATDNWTIANAALFPKLQEMHDKGTAGRGEDLFPEHLVLLGHDIPTLEGLTNLEALVGKKDAVFVAFPLKLKEGGNGSPVRAAALLYDD